MLTIRTYRPTDIEAIYSLFYNSVHKVAKKDYTPEQLAAWAKPQRNTERWDEGLLKQLVWVAEIESEVVGFTSLHPDSGYLDFMYTHHQYQGQGIATALLAALETEAIKLNLPELTTDSSLTARQFFLSHGFQLVAENIKTVDGIEFLNSRLKKILTVAQ